MEVYGYVAIDVVESLSVRTVYIDGELPCCTPVCDVSSCKCVSGSLQFECYTLYLSSVRGGCEAEFAEGDVERLFLFF